MKKLLVLSIYLALFFTPGRAWEKIYHTTNSEAAYSVKQTDDGGYIVTGFKTTMTTGSDVYLLKTDAWGDTIWTQVFGPKGTDVGQSVLETDDGGYIVVGQTDSAGSTPWDIYLIKTTPEGHLQWYKTYGGLLTEFASDIKKTTDGGYIIVGATNSSGAGGADVYLVKTDASGTLSWSKTYGGSAADGGFSVQPTADDGFIIVGATYSFDVEGSDIYLIKTNSWGDTLWTKTYGAAGDDWGYCVQQTSDGGYLITGLTNYFGAGGSDVYFIKTDSLGEEDWTKTFGGSKDDGSYSALETWDGGFIITGWTYSYGAGGSDVYLIKIDAAGQTKWTKTFGISNTDDAGASIQQTSDEGYIIAGWLHYPIGGDYDLYLIKTDSLGSSGVEEVETKTTLAPELNTQSPAHGVLNFSFFLPTLNRVKVELYDIAGKKISVLADGEKPAGWHHLTQNPGLPSGIYYLRLSTGLSQASSTKKIILFN